MAATGQRKLGTDAGMASAILLLGGFLLVTGHGPAAPWVLATAGRPGPDLDQLLGAATTAAGVGVASWWMLCMSCAFLAAALERTGRKRAAAAASRFCPAFMRRLALAFLAVQIVSTPLAYADERVSGPGGGPTQSVAAPAVWVPTAGTIAQVSTGSGGMALEHQAPLSGMHPNWRPTSPITEPDLVVASPSRARQAPPTARAGVTVLAGDTLWDIAARDLGSTASDVEVALHWPRWYQANKAQIGENPDVLLPGQVLKPPAAA